MTERDTPNPEEVRDYRSQLEAIIDRPLVPYLIDSYADGALNDLIELVEESVTKYQNYSHHLYDHTAELEEAAFGYYGLGNIEVILDNIASKADEIRQLADVIATRTKIIDHVIVPPDPADTIITSGGNSPFEHSEYVPKLKTLLFILSNDFGVDLQDSEQLNLTSGKVSDSMMRRVSYTIVETPKLSRTTFICDEANNITYVFNGTILEENEIKTDDLLGLTKTELNKLIAENPSLGKHVRFTNSFVSNLIKALENPTHDLGDSDGVDETGRYLYPKAPEDYLSRTKLAKQLHISGDTLRRVVKELEESLGPVNKYRFIKGVGFGYSPEQQAIVAQYLEDAGLINNPIPENYLTLNALASVFGTDKGVIGRAMDTLSDTIGEVKKFKFGTHYSPALSPEQQIKIKEYLDSAGLFLDEPPEGYLSIAGIAAQTGVSHAVVSRAVEAMANINEDTHRYKTGATVTYFYSPEQQQLISQYLEGRGLLKEKAPEGCLSTRGIAKLLSIDVSTVINAVNKLGEDLGAANEYRFGPQLALAYSPAQQQQIYDFLERKGVFAEMAPEGYLTVRGLAAAIGISKHSIKKAVSNLGNELGNAALYRFGHKIAIGYSPKQQELIKQHLSTNPRLNIGNTYVG